MIDLTREDTSVYCFYYQAAVLRRESWFVVAVLKSFDHVSLDRTIDRENSIFEFFVPAAMEQYFLQIITNLQKRGLISNVQKLPNRLRDPNQEV